ATGRDLFRHHSVLARVGTVGDGVGADQDRTPTTMGRGAVGTVAIGRGARVHQFRRDRDRIRHDRHAGVGTPQTRVGRSTVRAGYGRQTVSVVPARPAVGAVSTNGANARVDTHGRGGVRQLGAGESAVHRVVPERLAGILPAESGTRHGPRFAVQRGFAFHRVGGFRRAVGGR